MADESMFLRPKAPVDPSCAVAPALNTLNLLFLKFPMLASYVQSQEAQVGTRRNSELHDGFFDDVGEQSVIHAPTAPGGLRDAFGLDGAQAEQLALLLRETTGPSPYRHIERGGRIRYFGSACLVLQTPQGAVVTDPFIGADSGGRDRYTLDDLPDFIDLVLVTRGHQDPIVLETLLQLRGRIGTIVAPRSSRGSPEDPSTGLYLSRLGFPVVEADDYDDFAFPGGRVVATPFLDEHGDPDTRGESTYWVELAGRSAFIGTDSSGIDPVHYRCIRQQLGTADYAFLGLERDRAQLAWLYPALLSQLSFGRTGNSRKAQGLSAERAAAITTELGVGEAYVYAMGVEPWPEHVMATTGNGVTHQFKQIDEFLTWCADRGIKAGHLLGRQEWRW
ncbi:MBL fold metallo-hydrolase [Streptomyces sp. NPDC050528]|uniref:MBL fold metallo-hydrolase n=1 Tax=unclassified Streptomyces TaxID=2593676 RepID=UPI00379C3D9E